MGRSFTRGIAACAIVGFVLMSATSAAHAQEDTSSAEELNTLTERITDAAAAGSVTPEALAEATALPVDGAGSLQFDAEERITAVVMFAGAPSAETLAAVEAMAEIDTLSEKYAGATVRVDPAKLADLASVPGVLTAYPATAPMVIDPVIETPASTPAEGARALAAAPAGESCGPIPIEADSPLRSAEAREAFGIDGSGVTVGIISDSFDTSGTSTTWADDVASGALPGEGNPCGRNEPVGVLKDAANRSDEGRGMTQLVHGIAPGANLLFHAAGASQIDFAVAIDALVDAGADIIVDDVGFYDELTYQQGIVSVAINAARADGAAYFTALGNANAVGAEGTPSAGLPIASWQTTAYRPMACPDWVFADDDPLLEQTVDCLDFDPDPGVETAYDTLQLKGTANGTEHMIHTMGSVGEPVYGATTDYEWRFYEMAGDGTATQLGTSISRVSAALPNFTGFVPVHQGTEVRMVMVRTGFQLGARLPAVSNMLYDGAGIVASRAFLGNETTDWVGETPSGHAGDGSATSVGSLDWAEPTQMRVYSSLGPATMLYEPIDLASGQASNRLPAPEIVGAPDIVAVDGVQTTFFGEDEGTPEAPEYRFYGTSAAAPNAAAVAALGLSYAPGLDQAALTQHVIDSANPDVVNPYAPRFEDEDVFGAGRVDAMALIESLPAAPELAGLRVAKAAETELEIAWDESDAETLTIELFVGDPVPENGLEAEQLPAGSVTRSFTGLTPDTAYTVRLTPTGDLGVVGGSETLEARTLAAETVADDPVEPEPGTNSGADGDAGSGSDAEGSSAASGDASGTPAAADEAKVTASPLATTGGSATTPLFIVGGVVVLLGAAAVTAQAIKRRRTVAK